MVILIFLRKLKFWSMEVAVFEFGPKNQISPNAIDGDFFLMLIHTFLKLLTKCQLYIILFGVITHFDCTIYKSSYIYNTSQVELEILRNFSTIFRTAPEVFPKKAILKHFVIFTLQLVLANIGKFVTRPILKNICEWLHFWKVFCENVFFIRT